MSKKDWKVHKKNYKDNNGDESIEQLVNKANSYYDQGNYAKSEKIYRK